MTNKDQDHHFSSFAMGISVGVVAALLFGTEEGRKVIKEILNAIPEKYKEIPKDIFSPKPHYDIPPTPIINPEETPHHETVTPIFSKESPPPAPPLVEPFRPKTI